jgi:hypothetical protein
MEIKMLIRLTEAYQIPSSVNYGLREISVNPANVVAIRAEDSARQALVEGRMPEGISQSAHFSRVYLNTGGNGLNVLVVGDQSTLEKKFSSSKQLLRD